MGVPRKINMEKKKKKKNFVKQLGEVKKVSNQPTNNTQINRTVNGFHCYHAELSEPMSYNNVSYVNNA